MYPLYHVEIGPHVIDKILPIGLAEYNVRVVLIPVVAHRTTFYEDLDKHVNIVVSSSDVAKEPIQNIKYSSVVN